ncbi:MAG: nucleotidyltransferase substrate binding protein [Anaerolineales bacterium]
MSQTLNLSALQKAITSLEQLYARVNNAHFMAQQDSVVRLGLQAGLIQNLEFTYELCWKAMKRWLEMNAGMQTDGITRRELFRMAAENHLIADVEAWMLFHEFRNQTSHRYDSELADNGQALIGDFIHAAHALLNYLKAHND